MNDRTSLAGTDGEDRNEGAAFIRRMVGPLVAAKVRQQRARGLPDDAIPETVRNACLDRTCRFGAHGFDAEPGREKYASWIERAIEDALAEPWPDDLAEPLRRIDDDLEGEPIILANGEPWTFPRLDLNLYPRTLGDGTIDLQYAWTQDVDGVDLLTALLWIDNGISDPAVVLPHVLTAGSILLRRHYSVTVAECRRLMPIDPENPECLGELVALAPDEMQVDSIVTSRPITELVEGIVQALLALLAPVVEDLRRIQGEADSGEHEEK